MYRPEVGIPPGYVPEMGIPPGYVPEVGYPHTVRPEVGYPHNVRPEVGIPPGYCTLLYTHPGTAPCCIPTRYTLHSAQCASQQPPCTPLSRCMSDMRSLTARV